MDSKTAREAWDKLKGHYQTATYSNKIFLLRDIFLTKLPEDGNMEDHITDILNQVNRLAAVGKTLESDMIAALLLANLPDSYSTLIMSLESRDEKDLTVEFVKSRLTDEYKRRKNAEKSAETAQHETSMRATRETVCFFCKSEGHWKRDCPKYIKWKSKQNQVNTAQEYTDEYFKNRCFMVNTSYLQPFPAKDTISEACNKVIENKNAWILDSGATSHMTANRDFFTSFNPDEKGHVLLADEGEAVKVQGKGSGIIKYCANNDEIIDIRVDKVLYIPRLSSNLLSVKKLTNNGFKVIFEKNVCSIIKEGALKVYAKCLNNLYQLPTIDRAYTVTGLKHNKDCQHTWHTSFGYRDIEAIKQLENGLATGIKIKDCGIRETCEICIKGKMSRVPFPKESTTKTEQILDLIHTDVCGPMQTITPGKKRYILTIIDDYSRFTKLYFMESKDETTKYIKHFCEFTETQLNKKPKTIRSGRRKEYVNNNLINYLHDEGIKIQYTAGYSPQQNGVAERKNRSLIEMVKCMLLDANIKKKYWAEAAHTANYLQNVLSTKSTGKTPY